MSEYNGYDVRLLWAGAAVGQVRDVKGPGTEQDAIDVTTRDDAGADQFVGGLRDGGEVAFDVIYDPGLASQTVLRAALEAGTLAMVELHATEIETARPGGMRGFGRVTEFEPGAPMRDALIADVTIQWSGVPAQIDYLVDHVGNFLVTAAGKYLIA